MCSAKAAGVSAMRSRCAKRLGRPLSPWARLTMGASVISMSSVFSCTPLPVATGLHHYARGVAFAATGRGADAARELAAVQAELAKIPATDVDARRILGELFF